MASGCTCIIVVDGAYQIQNLPPAFGLRTHNLNFPKKVLFKGIQNRQGRILILNTVHLPIQCHAGRKNIQRVRGISSLPIPNLITLLLHNYLPRRIKTYWPLLRLGQTIHPEFIAPFKDILSLLPFKPHKSALEP
jgi:hypothetical protein